MEKKKVGEVVGKSEVVSFLWLCLLLRAFWSESNRTLTMRRYATSLRKEEEAPEKLTLCPWGHSNEEKHSTCSFFFSSKRTRKERKEGSRNL